jgi:hypothetical protein
MTRRPLHSFWIAVALGGVTAAAAWAGTSPLARNNQRPAQAKLAATGPKTGPSEASEPAEAAKLLATGQTACEARRHAEGLVWFRQAAAAGSVEGVYRVGRLLLEGAKSDIPGQSVAADVPEGVRWIFRAATNGHPAACRQMAAIHLNGLGVKTNLVHAYAWLRLSAALTPEAAAELDALAPKLDAAQLLEAQNLATRFLQGEWPPPPCKPVVTGDPRLAINGLTLAQSRPSVVINHRTFVEGETGEVPIRGGQLLLTCVEIRPDAVLVEVAGENEARLLPLR